MIVPRDAGYESEQFAGETKSNEALLHDLCNAKTIAVFAENDLLVALKQAAENEKIADSMRDYWMNLNDGAER